MLLDFLHLSWREQLLWTALNMWGRALLFAGGAWLWLRYVPWPRRRVLVVSPGQPDRLAQEISRAFGLLLLDTLVFVGFYQAGGIRFSEPAAILPHVITYVAMTFWFEIYFYASHRLLHTPRLFWIHRYHHRTRATNPWNSLSFSYLERLILIAGMVMIPGLFSQLVPIPLAGWGAYLLVNYFFNVYGHSNVELQGPDYPASAMGRIFNTTSFHSMHHVRPDTHFGLFFPWLDQWLGTMAPEYPEFHRAGQVDQLPAKPISSGGSELLLGSGLEAVVRDGEELVIGPHEGLDHGAHEAEKADRAHAHRAP